METFECRSCGEQLPHHQRYEDGMWCVACVDLALLDQEVEDTDRVIPQVFSL